MILNEIDANLINQILQTYGQILLFIVLIVGLIFFITYGIVKQNQNYVTRGFVFLLVGGILTLILAVITIIDYAMNKPANLGLFSYLSFIGVSLFYTLVLGLVNIHKGKQRYQRLNFKKTKPSINRDINQHIYVVYKAGTKIILKKNKDKISGFELLMNKNHLFKDELLNSLNNIYKVTPLYDDLKELGVCTINNKKPDIYYCYLVEIEEITYELSKEEVVDQFDVITLELDIHDKEMILRTLMREEFKIYL